MKKIVMLLLIAICSSPVVMAQTYDDLYYAPKKSEPKKEESRKATSDKYRTGSSLPVVVKDRKGKVRNADEYNRRYDASDNNFEVTNDTLYVKEKAEADRGKWVNGFNGSKDDYEYAQRIVRFRNPRFAVSISSPYYWDIVYGANSWDWNVYTDDFYAYAFPTFTNRLWWDWRYGSYGMSWGWSPYYAGNYWGGMYGGYYGGYYGGNYGGYWDTPYYGNSHWGHGHGGWASNAYYNDRRSIYNGSSRSSSYSSRVVNNVYNNNRRSSYSDRSSSNTRVVGTRDDGYSTSRRGSSVNNRTSSGWIDSGGSRRSTYTRPSSTRTYSTDGDGGYRRGSTSSYTPETTRSSSYSRGNSSTYTPDNSTSRRSSYEGSNRSSSYTPSTSTRSSESSSRSSSSSSGSSSRSSNTGYRR